MARNRIEKYLLTEEKKKEYKTIYISSIEEYACRHQKTLELSENGQSIENAGRLVSKEFENHLSKAAKQYDSGEISAKQYVGVFKKTSDINHWPSLIVAVKKETPLKIAADQLGKFGYFLSKNENELDKNQYDKFSLFRFLHVHIPPEQVFIHHIGDLEFTKYIFDAEREFKHPDPMPTIESVSLKKPLSLREMVFPDGFPEELNHVGSDIKICIIDSGIDGNHPDFKNRIDNISGFTGESKDIDESGHGTHVAGIALGSGDASNKKYAGISPNSKLIVSKVLKKNGSGTTQNILSGLRWAYEQDADVINMSLGGAETFMDGRSVLALACDMLVESGKVVCISAGNSGPEPGTISSPGDSRRAICVAASDGNKTAKFSSRGPTDDPSYTGDKPDIAAPGVNIISTKSKQASDFPDIPGIQGYTALSGTSMSSPVIAGLSALFLSYARQSDLNLKPDELKQILLESAESKDEGQGKGIVNGNRAFDILKNILEKQREPMKPEAETDDEGSPKKIRYIESQLIGEGGCAFIYRVFDTFFQRLTAIKIPKEYISFSDDALDEVRKHNRVKHRSAIEIYDINYFDNRLCIFMEYADGGSMRDLLQKKKAFSVQESLKYIKEIAEALSCAHTDERPVLHYDLKPENILFKHDKENRTVIHAKLTDFGVSKAMYAIGEQAEKMAGTPNYIGPEQLKSQLDPRSEIWSLGTLFYEMLTGEQCFEGDYATNPQIVNDIYDRIRKKEFVRLSEKESEIPIEVIEIVHTMLRSGKQPEYKSMAEVIQDLDRVINPAPEEENKPREIYKEYKEYKEPVAGNTDKPDILSRYNPGKIKESSPWKIILIVLLFLFIASGVVYYAEKNQIIDIPFLSSLKADKAKFLLPENIRSLGYEKQFEKAMEAEKDDRTYSLAYDILENIETNSNEIELKRKASYYKACLALLRLGNYNLAIKDFKAFLKQYPESQYTASANLYLGDCYVNVNKIEKAVSHFRYVYTNFPDNKNRQTTEIFLQKAKEKLVEKGNDTGFIDSFLHHIDELKRVQAN